MAVGDAEFRQKCYETMERRLAEGRTLVLGAGKAGGSMAAAVDALWPKQAPMSGLVVTRYDSVPPAYRRPHGSRRGHRHGGPS